MGIFLHGPVMEKAKVSSGQCRVAALLALAAFSVLYALLCWVRIEWTWETADAFAFGIPWGMILICAGLLVTNGAAPDASGGAK